MNWPLFVWKLLAALIWSAWQLVRDLLTIAWKSIHQRWLASSLTALSIALGVALMVAVLVVNGVVTRLFNQNATGFHLIVGAQGRRLHLLPSTFYFPHHPIEIIPFHSHPL